MSTYLYGVEVPQERIELDAGTTELLGGRMIRLDLLVREIGLRGRSFVARLPDERG